MDAQLQRAAGAQPRPQAPGGGDFTAIVTVLVSFIAIFIMVLVPPASNLKNSLSILHQVPEGHVGAYWRGGALLKTLTDPGFHLKMPLITHFEPIQVTLKTYLVRDIPCGTKGGVMIKFEKIEVVYRLHKDYVYETLREYGVQYGNIWIYDNILHEIIQFCSVHSFQQVYIDMFDQIGKKLKDALQANCNRYVPGIQIISVRVTKLSIPDSIRRNFEQIEKERTKVLVAVERQRVAEKEAETCKKIAMSEAEKNVLVSKIQMEQKSMEKDSASNKNKWDWLYPIAEKLLIRMYTYLNSRPATPAKLLSPPVSSLLGIHETLQGPKASPSYLFASALQFLMYHQLQSEALRSSNKHYLGSLMELPSSSKLTTSNNLQLYPSWRYPNLSSDKKFYFFHDN